jgi:hypothetical protein
VLLMLVDMENAVEMRIARLDYEKADAGHRYADELKKFLEDTEEPSWHETNQADRDKLKGLLQYATKLADTLELQAVHDRIEIFTGKLRYHMELHELLSEVRTLRETFDRGINYKYLYLYPAEKVKRVLKFEDEWRAALAGFAAIRDDALAATDCYALGHNTAAVFHSMRVLEHGLRAMATAVNLVFDVQQWQTIIEGIEKQIREIGDRWPKTTAKSDWTSFFSGAAKEFFYFKDGWRNYVSHGGDPYDADQASSVLEHVKVFMNHLSTRLGD